MLWSKFAKITEELRVKFYRRVAPLVKTEKKVYEVILPRKQTGICQKIPNN